MPDYEKKLIQNTLKNPKDKRTSYEHHAWVVEERYKEQQKSRVFGGVDLEELKEKAKRENELREKDEHTPSD